MKTFTGCSSLLFLLAIVSFLDGQETRFVVEGEYSLQIKSPFYLSTKQAFDITFWSASSGVVIEGDGTRVLVRAPEGRHRITLKAYVIDWENRKTIPTRVSESFLVVGDGKEPPKDPPDEPEEPSLDDIEQASVKALRQLSDATTAARLFESINGIDLEQTTEALRVDLRGRIAAVMLTREGESRNKPWDTWRTAVSDEIGRLPQPIAPGVYAEVIRVLLKTLGVERTTRVIKFYTRSNCAACQRWERHDQPQFERLGYRVEKVYDRTAAAVPHFKIIKGRQSIDYPGYLSTGLLPLIR